MKLRAKKIMDGRVSMIVDSAYFACKPHERTALKRKQRPPMQAYMRHLIQDSLNEADDIRKVCLGCQMYAVSGGISDVLVGLSDCVDTLGRGLFLTLPECEFVVVV